VITVAVVLVLSYLVGAIPWSLLVVRWRRGIDLRSVGSGNLGATNTFRALGATGALAVLALDIAKGLVAPAVFARLRLDAPVTSETNLAVAAAAAAIAGHIFPVYTRFRGGKGIATTFGAFLVVAPMACALAALAFAAGLLASRGIVSVGSLLGAAALPFAVYAWGIRGGTHSGFATVVAAAIALVIVWKHSANLGRLARRQEPSLFRRAARAPAERAAP
jgi:glycerol-3-phosphate acyltransferase PlsY